MTPRELLDSLPSHELRALPIGVRQIVVALVEASENAEEDRERISVLERTGRGEPTRLEAKLATATTDATRLRAERDIALRTIDRLRTCIYEHFGLQPVMSPDELVGYLEKQLFAMRRERERDEARAEAEKWRERAHNERTAVCAEVQLLEPLAAIGEACIDWALDNSTPPERVGCSKEEHLHRLNYWRDTACHLCSLNSCGNHDDDCLVGKYLAAHPAPPPSIRAAVEAARKAEPTDVWARECESLGRERDALRAKLVNTEDAIKADGLRFDEAIRQRDEARAKLATAERERDGLRARLEVQP